MALKTVKKTSVAAMLETTQGTPVASSATDFFLAEEVTVTPTVEMNERNPYRQSLDLISTISGKRFVEVTLKTELKGSGAAGTEYDPLSALIQACAFDVTVAGGTSVTHVPVSDPSGAGMFGPGDSVTLEIYYQNRKHIIAGCMGNMKPVLEAGKICMIEFTLKGIYAAPTDASAGTETFNATQPPVLFSATLTLMGSATRIANKFEFDCGNEISERPDMNEATALKGFVITGRAPTGTCDPEVDDVANFDEWALMLANTEASTSLVLGGTAGNIITLTFPKTQIVGSGYGDRNGIRTAELALRFNQNAGDDWCSIVLT